MNTKPLENFAQNARRSLIEQVGAKLNVVLPEQSAARREAAGAMTKLDVAIRTRSRQQVIEEVAYTWFNRFCALRFMDANEYTPLGIVSPAADASQPEILAAAKMGDMDGEMIAAAVGARVNALLDGSATSHDAQGEAYRLLLVAACNYYNGTMPYLFEQIDDYAELLMPDDLLSANSILAQARSVMTPEVCQDVEVMGWLYQFYISEKKDQVFADLKKNVKISADNIPAATQLFTPNWIVRYLVENSLGRLWLLNRPNSRLADQMAYYIAPDASPMSTDHTDAPRITNHESRTTDSTTNFLKISTPEELRVCDPACGSGHMLVYAFDLLYAIYEEEGYAPSEIAGLILRNNLIGIEIDARAGAIAAFALTMKARAKARRFLRDPVQPLITVLHPIEITETELKETEWYNALGADLTTLGVQDALRHDLTLLTQIDNIGSLLQPQLAPTQIEELSAKLDAADNLLSLGTNNKVRDALTQLLPMARQYHVVVANPPYMGSKGMNGEVKDFLGDYYKDFKADLFAAFTVRILEMTWQGGFIGMMTPFNWMFLSSFEKLRDKILDETTLTSLVRPEFHAFFDSAFVTICGFTLLNNPEPEYKGAFIHLQDFYGADLQAPKTREAIQNPDCGYFYRASAADFMKIPGSPIAYWVSESLSKIFETGKPIEYFSDVKAGMASSDNDRFLRYWHEVAIKSISFCTKSVGDTSDGQFKWFPYNKGGGFRKWFGYNEHIINWKNDGREIKEWVVSNPKDPNTTHWSRRIVNTELFFQNCFTWGDVTSGIPSFRYLPTGYVIGNRGPGIFTDSLDLALLGYLNSKIATQIFSVLNQTLTLNVGNVASAPYVSIESDLFNKEIVEGCIRLETVDWNAPETSWGFMSLWKFSVGTSESNNLCNVLIKTRVRGYKDTIELQRLEIENNRIFIDAYNLQDELTPDVPLNEITLTCNPHYRYGKAKLDEKKWAALGERFPQAAQRLVEIGRELAPDADVELVTALEQRLLADTMAEFISYAVGCMVGRYSLDKPGLILANQGQTVADYLAIITSTGSATEGVGNGEQGSGDESQVPSPQSPIPTFLPDEDNVLPILDADWFEDDIVDSFRTFLRVTFGKENYDENMDFIEAALGRDIRSYFLKEFYKDHVKRYKKRPIYWLFSSPKGSFNALIYMHRYRPDTVSVVLNNYLRDYQTKLRARRDNLQRQSIAATASAREKNQAQKEIEKLSKVLTELTEYEDEILYPLATEQIAIDLDDGVKVNYAKFGKALKKI